MSSVQPNALDLIEFSEKNEIHADKQDSNIVQKMVTGETASATLIATAVAKLTSSSLTCPTSVSDIASSAASTNESESDSNDSPQNKATVPADLRDEIKPSAPTETVQHSSQVCKTTKQISISFQLRRFHFFFFPFFKCDCENA